MKYTLVICWVVLGLLSFPVNSQSAQSWIEIEGRRYILPYRQNVDKCPKPTPPSTTVTPPPPEVDIGGNLNTIMDLKDTVDTLKKQLAEKDALVQKIQQAQQPPSTEKESPFSPAIPLGGAGLGAVLMGLARYIGFKNQIGL